MQTTNQQPPSHAVHNEKNEADTVEKVTSYAEEGLKPTAQGKADRTGAVAKTDPEEIALVRKIDWRLMVRFLRN